MHSYGEGFQTTILKPDISSQNVLNKYSLMKIDSLLLQ